MRAAFVMALVFAASTAVAAGDPLGIVVPIYMKGFRTYDDGIRVLHRLNSEYGVKQVLITGGPEKSIARTVGWEPGLERYVEFAKMFARIKRDLSGTDLQIGWWNAPTLAYAKNGPFQHMVGDEGGTAIHTGCPLDSRFVADLAMRLRCVAAIGRPNLLLLEDDCHFGGHHGARRFTCYCPLHLAAVGAKIGRAISRDELVKACKNPTEANFRERKAFAETMRETMEGLGKAIRSAIDEVSPDTRIGITGRHEYARDGNSIFTFAKAVAGDRHRPLLRFAASAYDSNASYHSLIACFRSAAWACANMPPEIERMQELDQYPHSHFFLPDSFADAMLFLGAAFGTESVLYYSSTNLGNPLVGDGYFKVLAGRRPLLEAYRAEIAGKRLCGVEPLHVNDQDDIHRYLLGGPASGWGVRLLMRYGIPQTARSDSAAATLVIGDEARLLPDAKAKTLLERGGVMLDGEAAAVLCERGYAALIGADVKMVESIPSRYEIVQDAIGEAGFAGEKISNYGIAPATAAQVATVAEISSLRPGCENVAEFVSSIGETLSPSAIRFRNASGGKVAVLAHGLFNNNSASVFSEKKRELVRLLFNWLSDGAIPAMIDGAPNVSLLVHQGDGKAVLMVTVLRPDVLDGIDIQLSRNLKGSFEELGADGKWISAATVAGRRNGSIRLVGEFRPGISRIFRCVRGEVK